MSNAPTSTVWSLGIDLAQRYSAAALLSPDGEIVMHWTVDVGAAQKPADPQVHFPQLEQFVDRITEGLSDVPETPIVTLENLSQNMINPRPALHLRGAILHAFWLRDLPVESVMATTWQRELGYKRQKGRSTKGWAKEKFAEVFEGYDLTTKGKESIDVRDAALIAHWRQLKAAPQA